MLWNYWDVVRQAFFAHLGISFVNELTYYAALAFGVGAPGLLAAAGFFGNALASLVLVAVGAGIAPYNTVREDEKFLRFQRQMNLWGVWLLAIPGLRFHGLLIVFFALIGLRPRKILLIALIEHALRYGITAFLTRDADLVSALIMHFLRKG